MIKNKIVKNNSKRVEKNFDAYTFGRKAVSKIYKSCKI